MRSFENSDCLDKIEHDLKFLNSIYKSENYENRYLITNLFIAGSKKYLNYLNNKNYLQFYKIKLELIDKKSIFNDKELNYYNKILNSKKIINNYSEYMLNKALGSNKSNTNNNLNLINTNEEKKEIKEKSQITPNNIFINNYSFYTESSVDFAPIEEKEEDFIIINNIEDINNVNKIDDVNLLSFHSVISFFDDLCKIGRNLRGKDSSKYKEIIINEITKINKNLPANVYLPFLTNNTRNYIIVHIPVTEIKVFKTKERVPFMLVFEMIRIEEILYQIEKENSLSIFNLNNDINLSDDEEFKLNTYAPKIIEEDKKIKKLKSNEIKKDKKKNKKKKKKKKEKENEDEQLIKIISESDIELSKQISIFSMEEEKKKIENEKNQKEDDKKLSYKKGISAVDKLNYLNNGLITESKFIKYEKSSLRRKNSIGNGRQRSLSFDFLDEDKKSIEKLIDKENNEKEIDTSNKEHNIENENQFEIKIEENINIDNNNLIINKEDNNLIDTKENNNLLINTKPTEDDASSEQSEEDQKIPIISNNDKINPEKGGINIKNLFGEKLEDQKERLQLNSPFRNFKTFNIFKAIIKAGEDLKQEQFATQLIGVFREIFSQNNVDCWLSSYEVISTGQDCGLVEMISNSLSMDQIKQKTGLSLKQFYIQYFGAEKKKKYQQAVKNFIRSLAGYSLVCYFLQIKDRHNGNILIDSKGHLIHIDFGFMLSNAPGKGFKFEKAPFKITDEMLELIGGINSDNFKEYRKRLFKGYFSIYDNFEKIQKLVEFMFMGQGKYFPCFIEKENALSNLKERLRPKDNMSKQQKMKYIDDLLSKSIDNWTTTYYDKFQYYIQGIFY